jgi:AraC family transcriptional regulator, transcriptional activator for feuABC-ybbA operon
VVEYNETIYIPESLKIHHYNKSFRSKQHRMRRHALGYVTSGSGRLIVDGQTYFLEIGTCFLLSPSNQFQLNCDEESHLKLYFLQYNGVKIRITEQGYQTEMSMAPALRTNQLVIELSSYVAIEAYCAKLQQSLQTKDHESSLRSRTLFYELLLHLQDIKKQDSVNINESIQRTMTYMQQHYSEPIETGELPKIAGLTPSSYCRAFKKATGLSPGNYLTQLRINRAKELMMLPNYTLKQIGLSVGFTDQLYFSRVFKKSESYSPSAYMRRHEKKVVVVSGLCLQDHLLALGIEPIAAPSYPSYYATSSGFPSYLHHLMKDTKPLNAERRIDTGEVFNLSPDYILKMDFMQNPNHKWEASGSTIFLDGYTSWDRYLREIAGLLKKEREAEQIIQRIVTLEQAANKELTTYTSMGKWAIIRLLPNDCRLYGINDNALTDLFYHRLGFQPDDRLTHSSYKPHAMEELMELNPENLMIIWSEHNEVEQVSKHPMWKKLKAVKENRVYCPDSKEWDPWGPIGREHMIREVTNYFLNQNHRT